jgi:hypothetical protein
MNKFSLVPIPKHRKEMGFIRKEMTTTQSFLFGSLASNSVNNESFSNKFMFVENEEKQQNIGSIITSSI